MKKIKNNSLNSIHKYSTTLNTSDSNCFVPEYVTFANIEVDKNGEEIF